jgi:hypothetical protein
MADINGVDLKGMKIGAWGENPTIVFGTDRYPFSFGGTKAKHILDCIKDNSMEAVVDAMLYLVSLSDPDWVEAYKSPRIAAEPKPILVTTEALLNNAPKLKGKPVYHPENDEDEVA